MVRSMVVKVYVLPSTTQDVPFQTQYLIWFAVVVAAAITRSPLACSYAALKQRYSVVLIVP